MISITKSYDNSRFAVWLVRQEDRPSNSKFLTGSFNLVDYDNSRNYKKTRD
ncbi:hypothetical protein C1H46_005508 [Malus baccata]|uniref:Uncharacterized protein n=1 Tax=Malus baccata TaxID=106549 RepID=A0A540NCX0_MALBA|nr:hypothetical protein C1H46_005508 [Malus baccata]